MTFPFEQRSSGGSQASGIQRRAARAFLCVWAFLWVAAATAQQLEVSQTTAEATVLTLTDPDGSPLAHEAFEVSLLGDEQAAVHTGRTDAHGRVLFLPDRPGQWRLKVFSEQGMTLDMQFEAGPGAIPPAGGAEPPIDLAAAVMIGLGALFGIFGLHQLFMRRRKKGV